MSLGGGPVRVWRILAEAQRADDVFDSVALFVASFLDGRFVALLAYGQTGTGKTHSMVAHHPSDERPDISDGRGKQRWGNPSVARPNFRRLKEVCFFRRATRGVVLIPRR